MKDSSRLKYTTDKNQGNNYSATEVEFDEEESINKLLKSRQKRRLDMVHKAKDHGYYTYQCALDSKSGPLVSVDDREYKMLSSYDYLGLIGNKEIESAAIEAISKFGTGSGGVRLLSGTNKLHLELEEKLAKFKGTEAALTYTSGYHANLAVLSALMDSSDMALVDSKVHQSTIDACKLSSMPYRRYEHNNSNSLEDHLKRYSGQKRILIISEGVFSMDGDTCRLDEIVALKNKYGALLMIDEAHSIGILGKQGRGIDSHFNISPDEVDIFTGSLSKAIPANGGFVAGSRELITYLQHGSSLYIFSAAMGPPSAASVITTLRILETDEDMLRRLWENTDYLKNGLQLLGYDTGLSTTPIIPIIIGLDRAALNFSKSLFDLGIIALPVIFPAVKSKESRLRLCATAAQDKSFLDEVIQVFRSMAPKYI